jgi:hypothetical protein
MSTHRNTSAAHPTFTRQREESVLEADPDLLADAHVRLVQRTAALHRLLRRLYPEIASLIDTLDPPEAAL